jgi:hypothetical protein
MAAAGTAIRMGDPRAAGQLLAGFYDIEANSWRWTKRQFAVSLRAPKGSAQRGAVLVVSLTVPPPVIDSGKYVTLTATVNGTKLSPETWSSTGNYVYQRVVPPDLLTGDSTRVDFELDKAMPPSAQDARELGIVVARVALEPK